MEVSEKRTVLKAEPLKLQDKLTDDWIQPFACNHVVVNITADAESKEKLNDKAQHTSYCVMCGELVAENLSEKGPNVTVDDIRQETRKKKGHETKPNYDESKDRRKVFSSSRRMGSSLSFTSTSNTRACSIHGHKKLKYFCEDHQEVCCSVCVNVLHRNCQRIMFIKDEIHGGWSSHICEETLTALDAMSKGFRHILDYNESARHKLKSQVLDFRKRRDELRAHLLHILDEFEKKSEKKIKKFIKISEEEIETTLENCRNAIRETEANREMLENVGKTRSMEETFIATQKVLLQREKYGLALSEAIKKSKDICIELIPETNIASIEDLRNVGSVQFIAEAVQFPEPVISSVSKIPKSELRSPRTTKDARSESSSSLKSPASFVGKFNVRLPEDKYGCENVGATFLTDGRVAIVDMKNSKLKVFDTKFTQACTLQLSSEPRGVTVISPQEVAVSLPDESKIQFISIGKKLQATKSILTNLPCYGITCHSQALVVLCDDGFSTKAIEVIDLDGKVLNTLKINKSGKVLLKNPWNITMSVDGQQISVTDKGRLVNFDVKGNILFEYTDKCLENARGLAVDDSGRFYVCGTSSNNVHQVSADGKQISIILTEEDVTAPQAVCYQLGKRYFLLTCVGNNNVYMYKLAKS
ncbi:uncharacterized protein LOC123548961 [Mercenaria mercenaria]|uniref:uncharacterized protein LOC123548961 n=1 Tax=Mercenaria mercenaria TaxID=6596 RepID=UPI00234EF5AE|nr:uncharacterized protein LOC123548961 [Mercenaria mercenaria]XP_053401816.1 uncharacterized protein LOC123548961 [Mercenaria mercenaria]XP_053401817.1 uncharacterized protein LOC123548961 [Mercenaria mercenaria]XP_053401818.1 uncharacterized protein LOC123548961 [Mercenaria mercenaria]